MMPYEIVDYFKDYVLKHIHKLPLEERLRELSLEERLREIPLEERLREIPLEDRLRGLGLSEEELREITKLIKSKKRVG